MNEISEKKYLSKKELVELEKTFFIRTRDTLLIKILLETGARQKEILNVTVNDVDIHDGTIYIKGLKGSKDRRLPLEKDTFLRLKSYIEESKPECFLFDITPRRARQIWQKCRPVGCEKSLHSLRHTFAINLYKKQRDLRLVQFALGHADINSTMVYASYVYRVQELKKLLRV